MSFGVLDADALTVVVAESLVLRYLVQAVLVHLDLLDEGLRVLILLLVVQVELSVNVVLNIVPEPDLKLVVRYIVLCMFLLLYQRFALLLVELKIRFDYVYIVLIFNGNLKVAQILALRLQFQLSHLLHFFKGMFEVSATLHGPQSLESPVLGA